MVLANSPGHYPTTPGTSARARKPAQVEFTVPARAVHAVAAGEVWADRRAIQISLPCPSILSQKQVVGPVASFA